VTAETTELTLPSRIESIETAAAAAAEFLGRLGVGDDVLFAVDMAVREAVTNAVLHGNKQNEQKNVEIKFINTPTAVEIFVRDEGEGFDPTSVADPTNPDNLLKTSGRGILFMRTFMDEVVWTEHGEGGTVVRMSKRL